MNKLYIVGTPIGNLEDITFRALRVLGEVDFVLCEDTRVTKKLLDRHNIKVPTISYHQHSKASKTNYIFGLLKEGKNLALVSDSGTPGISDPGGRLVKEVVNKLEGEVLIESVPGPSAVTTALSVSGFPADSFLFLGFPPHKKGRQKFLSRIIASEGPVVAFESKHRILKFLNELKNMFEEQEAKNKTQEPQVVVCRELSKMHEKIYRGGVGEIIKKLDPEQGGSKDDQKGEFVVIIYQ